MTGSLQIKNDKYYAVLNFKDHSGKRAQKWVSLGLPAVKGNKRLAEAKLIAFSPNSHPPNYTIHTTKNALPLEFG